MNYQLLEWEIRRDEFGDRSKPVAISASESALAEYCLKTYNIAVTKVGPCIIPLNNGRNYYTIAPTTIAIVVS